MELDLFRSRIRKNSEGRLNSHESSYVIWGPAGFAMCTTLLCNLDPLPLSASVELADYFRLSKCFPKPLNMPSELW